MNLIEYSFIQCWFASVLFVGESRVLVQDERMAMGINGKKNKRGVRGGKKKGRGDREKERERETKEEGEMRTNGRRGIDD